MTTTSAVTTPTLTSTTPAGVTTNPTLATAGLPTQGLLTSAGIGSGLNVNSIVQQLVAADAAPGAAQIQAQQTAVSSQLSAVGTLQGAVSAFQSAVSGLTKASAFAAFNATSSAVSQVTASASSSATPGNYQVQVNQLATSQQLASAAFSGGGTAIVGTGTLTLTQSGTGFNVAIDSTDNTVQGIASAINSATGNPGVQASVVQTTGGAVLFLTSATTGAASGITVTSAGGDGGLAQLNYNPSAGGTQGLTQVQAAQDAKVTISSLQVTSPSNTVTNAIAGLTLNLVSTSTTPATVSVATDTTTTANQVNAFVSAYNTLQGVMSNLGSYNASTSTAGPLLGDPLLQSLNGTLGTAVFQNVPGLGTALNSLAAIGVTPDTTGQLQVDSTKLQAALSSNYAGVGQIFASSVAPTAL